MAARGMRRAIEWIEAKDELRGRRLRDELAEEIERFAARLTDRLGLEAAANDLYREALRLRKT